MATYQTTITYPDGKQAELLAALRKRYGEINDGGVFRQRTPAECKQAFDAEVRSMLTSIYKEYKRSEAAVEDLGATV